MSIYDRKMQMCPYSQLSVPVIKALIYGSLLVNLQISVNTHNERLWELSVKSRTFTWPIKYYVYPYLLIFLHYFRNNHWTFPFFLTFSMHSAHWFNPTWNLWKMHLHCWHIVEKHRCRWRTFKFIDVQNKVHIIVNGFNISLVMGIIRTSKRWHLEWNEFM